MTNIYLGDLDLLVGKQDRNIYFNNITASNWVASTEYSDYSYQCDITCQGVTADMYAEVIFAMAEAISGNYAPICKTENNIVRLYSKANTQIVIPTIIINK